MTNKITNNDMLPYCILKEKYESTYNIRKQKGFDVSPLPEKISFKDIGQYFCTTINNSDISIAEALLSYLLEECNFHVGYNKITEFKFQDAFNQKVGIMFDISDKEMYRFVYYSLCEVYQNWSKDSDLSKDSNEILNNISHAKILNIVESMKLLADGI